MIPILFPGSMVFAPVLPNDKPEAITPAPAIALLFKNVRRFIIIITKLKTKN
jgi:hypothetical protein